MDQLEDIKARAEAARAPCASYWLLVFIYLMIHLFPVAQHNHDFGYQSGNSIEAAALGDPWMPPQSGDEVFALAVARAGISDGGFTLPSVLPREQVCFRRQRNFDPRGPPAFA